MNFIIRLNVKGSLNVELTEKHTSKLKFLQAGQKSGFPEYELWKDKEKEHETQKNDDLMIAFFSKWNGNLEMEFADAPISWPCINLKTQLKFGANYYLHWCIISRR